MAGSGLNRVPRALAALSGLIVLLILLVAGLWYVERLPSGLREWLYLQVVNPPNDSGRSPQEFDFFVVGHLYGSPKFEDQMPANLLLERLPDILEADPDFMVSLGDMVFRKEQVEFTNLEEVFLKKLTFPLYNTPGNHDVANNPGLYEAYFGQETYFGKNHGPAHLIFLDTEQVDCGLDDPQLDFLKQELNQALADPETRFIFVFMHKTLVFQNPEMKSLRHEQAMPNVWDCQNKTGANPLVEDFFKPAARQKPVIIFAGDVGAWGNLSPYYQRDPWLPLNLVMTGLGDTPQDNIIRVHVSPDAVQMDALFLEDMHSASLKEYDLDYWLEIARGGQ
ncbi:MAG: metallophosphoesterase [Anaerolineales bacterium]|nr:metallophosphoesterase [Anaerolineales bacterium]